MSKKRPYRLGKREATMAETRRRIVDAAAAEYAESGISATSAQMVARRAEVAPGTVLNHFPDTDDLVRAVIDKWTQEVRLPGPEVIDPKAPLAERLRTLFDEVYGMYVRSEWIYQVMHTSFDHPVLAAAASDWEATVRQMVGAALGDRVSEADHALLVGAFINPSVWVAFSTSGIPPERIGEMAATMASHWIESRK